MGQRENHLTLKEQSAQRTRPGKPSPACPLLQSGSPHRLPEHTMFSHNPLSVLRIACYSSITQLTPTQVSRTGSRVTSSRKPLFIPNLPLVPSLDSCKSSVPALSHHMVITIYMSIFSLGGQGSLLNHHCVPSA